MDLPVHNSRWKSITLRYVNDAGSTKALVTIQNGVIWRLDAEQIDVAQYGYDKSSALLPVDDVVVVRNSADRLEMRIFL